MKSLHALLVCVAFVLVGVAVLASTSVAAPRPDDRAGPLGAASEQPVVVVHADDRAGIRGVTETPSPAAAHPDNRPVTRGVPGATAEPSGTDWGTIGIGVGIGAAVVALVAAGLYTMRHGGHRPHRPIPSH